MAKWFGTLRKVVAVAAVAAMAAGVAGCSGDVEEEPDAGVDADAGHDADTDADDVVDNPGEPPECDREFADEGRARVFTFASKIEMDVAESYETYDDYFRGQVHQIADCLSDDRPNILLFPEDAGLHAGLIGSRGEEAREATRSDTAFLSLLAAYDDPVSDVDDRFGSQQLPRRILLSLTDTVWRAMDQTFSSIADDYDAWVLTSGNVAEVREETDPDIVDTWADPDLDDVESVFVPETGEVFNSAIIYNPDGELIERIHKPYLTVTEEEELALSYGSVDDLRPVTVGPMSFGVFTSKDAWMPPLNDRLGLLGADMQVQPEAFSGWTITHLDDQEEWLPDVITQSGWATVQKYPSYQYGAMPVLTGNFIDMMFDGQPVIWGQAHPGVDRGGFVGQHDRPGFLDVGDWAFDDPVVDNPNMSLADRRDELRELGEQMLPGAGDPHENAYIDGVVGRDLLDGFSYDPESATADGEPLETAITVGPIDDNPDEVVQRPRIAADGDRLAVTWQTQQNRRAELMVLDWDDNQNSYDISFPEGFTIGGDDDTRIIAPTVEFNDDGEPVVLAQAVYDDPGFSQVFGQRFEIAGADDVSDVDAIPVIIPYGDDHDSWLADLSVDGDRLAAVFTEGAGGHDRVVMTTADDGGGIQSFQDPSPVDTDPQVDPPNTRGNQWHPSVDVYGDTMVVAWTDFRDFQWDLYAIFSTDGGDSWSDARRIDGAGDGYERLHTDPRVVLVDEDNVIISWTFQSDRRPDTDAVWRSWNLADDELGETTVLDRDADTYPTHSWLPVVQPVGADQVAAAWMELRGDTSVIVVEIPDLDEPQVVSDPGGIAWWPDLVVTDDRVVVSWVEHTPDAGYRVRVGHIEVEHQ